MNGLKPLKRNTWGREVSIEMVDFFARVPIELNLRYNYEEIMPSTSYNPRTLQISIDLPNPKY